jgi:hypothetical protein
MIIEYKEKLFPMYGNKKNIKQQKKITDDRGQNENWYL